jgi:hypothetical protein
MHTRPNPQFGLMDSLMTIPANDFPNRLAQLVNWAAPGARHERTETNTLQAGRRRRFRTDRG